MSGRVLPKAFAVDRIRLSIFRAGQRGGDEISVYVPLLVRARALGSLLTGGFLRIGDSPLANTKDQTINAVTNIGLLAALILTIIVPITYDIATGIQTNAYVITSPAWIGQAFFVLALFSSWAFFCCTLFSILVTLVLNETTTSVQSQHLISMASVELSVPLHCFLCGWFSLTVMLAAWLIIVCFGLSAASQCGVDPNVECTSFPWMFLCVMIVPQLLSAHVLNGGAKLVAKLYGTRVKLSSPSSGMPNRPTKKVELAVMYVDLSAEEVWKEVCAHFDRSHSRANLHELKEMLIASHHAMALSCCSERLVDTLFEERLRLLLTEKHDALVKRLTELPERDTNDPMSSYPTRNLFGE